MSPYRVLSPYRVQSPLYQEIVEEAKREGASQARRQVILETLEDRFGPEARELEVELNAVEFDRLRDFHKFALKCDSLEGFRERLLS
jgi:hypothetical protein